MQCLRCFQHIFGRRPDAEIFRYIHRSHDTRGIQQELVWASYIMGVHARSGMQKVKAPDDLRIGIGEKCIRVAGLAAQIGGLFRRVHADGRAEFPDFQKRAAAL